MATDYEICPRERYESSVIYREFYARGGALTRWEV